MKKKKKEYEAQCPFKQRSRQTLKYYQSLTKNTTTDQRSKPIGKQSLDLILSREFRKPPPPPKPEYKPPPPKVIPGLVIASIPRSLFVSSSFSSVLDPLQGASSRDKEGERDKEKASGRKKDPGKKTKRRDGAGEGGKKVWETKGRANLKERGGARLSGGRQGMKEATKGADIRGEGARDQKRKHLREMRENGRRQRRRMISSTIDSKAKVDTRKGRGEESGGMEPDIDIPRIISKISNRTWNLTSLSLSGVGLSPRFFLIPLFRALRVDRVIQFLDISCNELTRGECTGADRYVSFLSFLSLLLWGMRLYLSTYLIFPSYVSLFFSHTSQARFPHLRPRPKRHQRTLHNDQVQQHHHPSELGKHKTERW